MFYRVANLPIQKVRIIKNFEKAHFSDFKRLVVNLKINPQEYNWTQKTHKPLNNAFPGSDRNVIVMQIDQSEVLHDPPRLVFTTRGHVVIVLFSFDIKTLKHIHLSIYQGMGH